MSTSIPQVVNTSSERSAEFIKLTIQSTTTSTSEVYTFSSSYRDETVWEITGPIPVAFEVVTNDPGSVPGSTIVPVTYTAVGGLLSVGEQHRDLRATSFDTAIGLTGLDPENIYMVLGRPLRGSKVEIYRGFYNNNLQLTNFVKRFSGIVTTYNISEDRKDDNDVFTCVVNCSSYKKVLENNIGGRRTNSSNWKLFYGTSDTSMDNIEKLAGAYFNFGKKV